MNGRIVILSDTHLGRPRGSVRHPSALRPLWRGARHLVLNGDTAEIHHTVYRAGAARHVVRLLELCEDDGVRVTLVAGNHDPYISEVRHLLLAGGRVFVTHGDVLHPAIAPWSPAAARMKRAYRKARRQLRPVSPDELEQRLLAAQHAAFTEWSQRANRTPYHPLLTLAAAPGMVAAILAYWRRIPHLAARFAARHAPAARCIVIGHTHHRGVWRIGGRIVINTGCFGFPSRPAAVIVEADRLEMRPIVHRRGLYRLSQRPIAEVDLTEADARAGDPRAARPGAEARRTAVRSAASAP